MCFVIVAYLEQKEIELYTTNRKISSFISRYHNSISNILFIFQSYVDKLLSRKKKEQLILIVSSFSIIYTIHTKNCFIYYRSILFYFVDKNFSSFETLVPRILSTSIEKFPSKSIEIIVLSKRQNNKRQEIPLPPSLSIIKSRTNRYPLSRDPQGSP